MHVSLLELDHRARSGLIISWRPLPWGGAEQLDSMSIVKNIAY